jgi:hypothetical protein
VTYSARQRARYRNRIRAYEATPTWAARSARYRRTHHQCQGCGLATRHLDVHHITYAHAFHGQEPDTDLRALCRPCHTRVHDLTRQGFNLADATTRVITGRLPHPSRRPRARRRVPTPVLLLSVLWLAAMVAILYTRLL